MFGYIHPVTRVEGLFYLLATVDNRGLEGRKGGLIQSAHVAWGCCSAWHVTLVLWL